MIVCYIFQDEYPWDVRAEKILTSLASHGVETHVVARNQHGKPELELLGERVHVHRLPRVRGRIARHLLNFPAFFSPLWLATIRRVVRTVRPGLIIVRDLPLSPAALIVGRLTGVPVVMDMAENYPAMIQDTWTYRGRSVVDLFVRNPAALKRLERLVVPRLDGILVVSRHSASRVAALGVPEHVIWVVSNTPRVNATAPGIDQDARPHQADELRLLYVGGMEESRGLDIVVRALGLLAGSEPRVRFIIVGRGVAEPALRTLASKLGVADRVEFAGWVDPARVPSVIASADVCIVPHLATEHQSTTVPNKIFDYMLQGRPVVVSSARALREIVESCQCGVVYQDTDPRALADAIARLRDPRMRAEMGSAGRQAVLDRYNWAREEEVLIEMLKHFDGLRSAPAT